MATNERPTHEGVRNNLVDLFEASQIFSNGSFSTTEGEEQEGQRSLIENTDEHQLQTINNDNTSNNFSN